MIKIIICTWDKKLVAVFKSIMTGFPPIPKLSEFQWINAENPQLRICILERFFPFQMKLNKNSLEKLRRKKNQNILRSFFATQLFLHVSVMYRMVLWETCKAELFGFNFFPPGWLLSQMISHTKLLWLHVNPEATLKLLKFFVCTPEDAQ